MATANFISLEELRRLVAYDPQTGHFQKRHYDKRAKRKGAMGSKKSNGYLEASLKGRKYLLHRLAWFYVYGVWPSEVIDHINGEKSDNRICNLRDVTHTKNMQNRCGGTKLGYVGRFRNGWRAQIQRDMVRRSKTFKTERECHEWIKSIALVI